MLERHCGLDSLSLWLVIYSQLIFGDIFQWYKRTRLFDYSVHSVGEYQAYASVAAVRATGNLSQSHLSDRCLSSDVAAALYIPPRGKTPYFVPLSHPRPTVPSKHAVILQIGCVD